MIGRAAVRRPYASRVAYLYVVERIFTLFGNAPMGYARRRQSGHDTGWVSATGRSGQPSRAAPLYGRTPERHDSKSVPTWNA